jgi:hypothetical protein
MKGQVSKDTRKKYDHKEIHPVIVAENPGPRNKNSVIGIDLRGKAAALENSTLRPPLDNSGGSFIISTYLSLG